MLQNRTGRFWLSFSVVLSLWSLLAPPTAAAQSQQAPPKSAPPAAVENSKAVEIEDFEFVDAARDDRVVPVRVYDVPGDAPKPVILFSHGLGGSRENSPYLGKYWANHGYVAVFMQHAGSDIDVIKNTRPLRRLQALKSAASYKSATARVKDVSFVIDELEKLRQTADHSLHGRLDLEQIGLSGHSFGAVTSMTMAGRKPPLGQKAIDEPRIDAFLAMSPQLGKGANPERSYSKLMRPIFCMTGTKDGSPVDRSVTPESRQQVYKSLPKGDKFHLVLEGAEHHAFGEGNSRMRRLERDPAHHGLIQKFSVKFWDAYLKQGPESAEAKEWLQSDAPRKLDGFKTNDVWQWK